MPRRLLPSFVGIALVVAGPALAQTPTRIRGTLAAVAADQLVIDDRQGGQVKAALAPDTQVTLVEPEARDAVKTGNFIGVAADTQPDGTLVAREIHVFPEAMRGTGEGHRPFDLGAQSTMTNGTIGQEVLEASGNRITVRYKGGEKVIVVPKDVPIVTFAPGTRSLLAPGAHVIVFGSKASDGSVAARNVLVGKDGLVPPM